MRDLFGDAEPEPRPPDTTEPTMHGEPSSSSRGPRVPHDPTRMPDGEPVPPGMESDLLGIEEVLDDRQTHLPSSGPGCLPLSGEKT